MPAKSKTFQIIVLTAVVGISALLMHIVTAPCYNSATNTIKYISAHKPDAANHANDILRGMNLTPFSTIAGIRYPRLFYIQALDTNGTSYVFMFKKYQFLTEVTARVVESKETPNAKPLRTETQLIKELAKRIGI
jgi:hypothetical protein